MKARVRRVVEWFHARPFVLLNGLAIVALYLIDRFVPKDGIMFLTISGLTSFGLAFVVRRAGTPLKYQYASIAMIYAIIGVFSVTAPDFVGISANGSFAAMAIAAMFMLGASLRSDASRTKAFGERRLRIDVAPMVAAAATFFLLVLCADLLRFLWPTTSWGILVSYGPFPSASIAKIAVLTNAIIGAAFTATAARFIGATRTTSFIAAACWVVASANVGSQMFTLLPTAIIPAYGVLYLNSGRILRTVATFVGVGASAVVEPGLAAAMAVVAFALSTFRVPANERRLCMGSIIASWAIGTMLGTPWLLNAPIFEPFPVAPGLVEGLRYSGGGVFPWELLLPSTASAVFGSMDRAFYMSEAHWGIMLYTGAGLGWGTLLLLVFGLIARSNTAMRKAIVAALALTCLFAFPSHIGGLALPVLNTLTENVRPLFLGGATEVLGLTFIAATAGARALDLLSKNVVYRHTAVTVMLLFLAIDGSGSTLVFENRPDGAMQEALRKVSARTAGATVALTPCSPPLSNVERSFRLESRLNRLIPIDACESTARPTYAVDPGIQDSTQREQGLAVLPEISLGSPPTRPWRRILLRAGDVTVYIDKRPNSY